MSKIQYWEYIIHMDDLTIFLQQFLSRCPVTAHIPFYNAVKVLPQGILGGTYYVKKPFQVQVFFIPPNTIIPEHTHPNVDSYEVYMGGQILFSHQKRWVGTGKYSPGQSIRVKPSDVHGGCFGPAGAVFMSVQHWLNDTDPSCVSKDYNGIALDETHESITDKLDHKELTWKDAASAETIPPYWSSILVGKIRNISC
jgi:hypothetical protein